MTVIKRDGQKVEFDKNKIKLAVLKAFLDVDGEETNYARDKAREIANYIESYFRESSKEATVELIQDLVEEKLMASNRKDVARTYINYRFLHKMARDQYSKLMDTVSEKLSASNVQNQNANVDEHSFGGRLGEANEAVTRQYALDYCVSDMAKNNHMNNEIYIHDLGHYAVGDHNCLTVPIDKLLANGFTARQTDVRPAQSVSTAFQLLAVIFQIQSLQQFGGVSASHVDWTMVPYVRKSFWKHFKDGLKYIQGEPVPDDSQFDINIRIDADIYKVATDAYQYAIDMTERETKQAVEGMYHNLNTLQSRSGNQLPFSSINYGTCTLPEGRMVTRALLNASIEGTGKLHKTSIFPCGIFQCMKGVNRKQGDPNYDLFQLALKSTAQRLYPNYANIDWSGNAGYDRNDPKTYFSTMGCVDGEELITYKFRKQLYVESFKRMWNRMSDYFRPQQQIQGNDEHLFLNASDVEIYDTNHGFVSVKKIIRNTSDKWLNVKLSHGRSILCTDDHPFETNNGVVYARDLNKSDVIQIDCNQYSEETLKFDCEKAWLLGFILCDGCYSGGHVSASVAFNSENDIIEAYASRMKKCFNNDVKVVERHRGEKGVYKDLTSTGNVQDIISYLQEKFGGINKKNRHIPNEVFSWDNDAKTAFLAGMIDADGYINPDTCGGCVVQIGSTNKELALQQMALAQSLGMPSVLYQNYYSSNKQSIRYRVEFSPSQKLIGMIESGKKSNNYNYTNNNRKFTHAIVNSVELASTDSNFSYDVETNSGHFTVSGIYSHNCRTANGWDINGFGQLKDGRGNICPVTIIMPTLAMEAKELAEKTNNYYAVDQIRIETFFDILDTKIHEAKDMLIERFNWICSQNPKSAQFMYENGTMEGYIPEEGIRSALKHGTLAIGQIGLAETLQILIGCDHTTEQGMALAKRIEQLFKDRCAEFKEKYKLNFGVYFTPAENLCYTAMKKFKEKYGEIPNVSDKDFFTNSMHVPVWKQIDPFEKIDIESQLTGYSSAGCITYVELSGSVKHNLESLETLVNYAMDHDIPYFAINVPNDTCMDCGYCDEINDTCPMCGGKNIKRLRRVTGYLTGDYKTAFNLGKQQEVSMRQNHTTVTI